MKAPPTSFVIFHIEPEIVQRPGPRPQHCTRGHTWDVGMHFAGFSLDFSKFGGITNGREEYCFFCLLDAVRRTCGRVVDRPAPLVKLVES